MTDGNNCLKLNKGTQLCPSFTWVDENGALINDCEYTADASGTDRGEMSCGTGAFTSNYDISDSFFKFADNQHKFPIYVKPGTNDGRSNISGFASATIHRIETTQLDLANESPLDEISGDEGMPLIVKFYFKDAIVINGRETKETILYIKSFNQDELDKKIALFKGLPFEKVEVTKFIATDEKTEPAFADFGSPDEQTKFLSAGTRYLAKTGQHWRAIGSEADVAERGFESGQRTVLISERDGRQMAVNFADKSAKLYAEAVKSNGAYPVKVGETKRGHRLELNITLGYTDGGADASFEGAKAYSNTPFADSFNKTRSGGRGDLPGFAANVTLNYVARFAPWFALKPGVMLGVATTEADRNNKDSTHHIFSAFLTLGTEFNVLDYVKFNLFGGLGGSVATGTNILADDPFGKSRTDGSLDWMAGASVQVPITEWFGLTGMFYLQDDIAGADQPTEIRWATTAGAYFNFWGDNTKELMTEAEKAAHLADIPTATVKVQVYRKPEEAFAFVPYDTVEMPNHKASAEETFEVNKAILKKTKFAEIPAADRRENENRTEGDINLEVYKTANVVEKYIRYLESIGINAGSVNIDIGAHADSAGRYAGNKKLSDARAESFKKDLEAELSARGITGFTFTYHSAGYSESKPVVIACKNAEDKFVKCSADHLGGKVETIALPEKYDIGPENPMFDKDGNKAKNYKAAADGHAQITVTQKVGEDGKTVKLGKNKEYYLEALRGSRRVETIATVTQVGMFEGPANQNAIIERNSESTWFNVKLNNPITPTATNSEAPVTPSDKSYFFKLIEEAKKNVTDAGSQMLVVVINLGKESTLTGEELEKSMRWLGGAVTYRMAKTGNGEKRIDIPVKVVVTRNDKVQTSIGINIMPKETVAESFVEGHAKDWSELILGRELDKGGYEEQTQGSGEVKQNVPPTVAKPATKQAPVDEPKTESVKKPEPAVETPKENKPAGGRPNLKLDLDDLLPEMPEAPEEKPAAETKKEGPRPAAPAVPAKPAKPVEPVVEDVIEEISI